MHREGHKDLMIAHADRFDKAMKQLTASDRSGLVYLSDQVAVSESGGLLVGNQIDDYKEVQNRLNSIGLESGAMLSINLNVDIEFVDMGNAPHMTIEKITYDVDAARSWASYQETTPTPPVTMGYSVKIDGATDWKLDEEPVRVMAEVTSPLTLINRSLMTISPNDMQGTTEGDLIRVRSSGISSIHFHGVSAGFLTYKRGNEPVNGLNIKWGPSKEDMGKAGRYYYRMMADPKYIWLYRQRGETIYRFYR